MPQLGVQDGGGAQESSLCCGNHEAWNVGNIIGETTLLFKAISKAGAVKKITQARHYAAANVDAARGAQGERQIASGSSKHVTKHFQCFDAQGLIFVQGAASDLGGRESFHLHVLELSDSQVSEF